MPPNIALGKRRLAARGLGVFERHKTVVLGQVVAQQRRVGQHHAGQSQDCGRGCRIVSLIQFRPPGMLGGPGVLAQCVQGEGDRGLGSGLTDGHCVIVPQFLVFGWHAYLPARPSGALAD